MARAVYLMRKLAGSIGRGNFINIYARGLSVSSRTFQPSGPVEKPAVSGERKLFDRRINTIGPAVTCRKYFEGNPHWCVYNMACPGNRMRWDLTPEDIEKRADQLIERSKAAYDQVGSQPKDELTYENSVKVRASSNYQGPISRAAPNDSL